MSQFSGGLGGARMLCIMNIYNKVFHLQPSQIQKYLTIFDAIEFFNILVGLFIDLRIIRNRKYMLVFVNLSAAMSMLAISSGLAYQADRFFI